MRTFDSCSTGSPTKQATRWRTPSRTTCGRGKGTSGRSSTSSWRDVIHVASRRSWRHKRSIDTILGLRQAHPSFWERWGKDDDVRTRADWEARFGSRVRKARDRLTAAVRSGISRHVAGTLDDLFENLNVVRNQIVHGGSAGTHGRGRTQVLRGAELVKALVPRFRSTIVSHIDDDWGRPPFPRVGEKADDKCLPPWLSPPP